MDEPEEGPAPDGPGLRELKKQRTRQSIVATAHRLFHRDGYDATTVEAIAAGAEVSVRTFFRYFPGKEEVALAPLDEIGELALEALRRRPADEPPLVALRAATLDAWAAMEPTGPSLRHYGDQLLLVGKSSPLSGAVLNRTIYIGDALADALGQRGAASAAGDRQRLTYQLAVVTFIAAIQAAVRAWSASGSDDLVDLLSTVESCLSQIDLREPPS